MYTPLVSCMRDENSKRKETGIKGTYPPCLARLLRDIRSRLDAVCKEVPLYVDVCGAVKDRVHFRYLEMVCAKGFGGLEVGE